MRLDLIVQAGLPGKARSRPSISPAEVLGNIFIFMFAGHEANANTLTFILILLACHPSIQKHLQHDIDRIVGSSSPSSRQAWSYERAYPLLSESMVGAVINESLRLFTVLPFIPKIIPNGASQTFKVADHIHSLPPGTLILVNTSALHRHPKYWPQPGRETSSANNANPVAAFDPASWFRTDSSDAGPQQGADRLRRPHEGSFVPFSDGSRGCLGKKFALVELCGVVTRIFSEYTVDLALDGISEEQNDDVQKRRSWEEARKRAEYQLSSRLEFKMSLRLAGSVPLTFAKRENVE